MTSPNPLSNLKETFAALFTPKIECFLITNIEKKNQSTYYCLKIYRDELVLTEKKPEKKFNYRFDFNNETLFIDNQPFSHQDGFKKFQLKIKTIVRECSQNKAAILEKRIEQEEEPKVNLGAKAYQEPPIEQLNSTELKQVSGGLDNVRLSFVPKTSVFSRKSKIDLGSRARILVDAQLIGLSDAKSLMTSTSNTDLRRSLATVVGWIDSFVARGDATLEGTGDSLQLTQKLGGVRIKLPYEVLPLETAKREVERDKLNALFQTLVKSGSPPQFSIFESKAKEVIDAAPSEYRSALDITTKRMTATISKIDVEAGVLNYALTVGGGKPAVEVPKYLQKMTALKEQYPELAETIDQEMMARLKPKVQTSVYDTILSPLDSEEFNSTELLKLLSTVKPLTDAGQHVIEEKLRTLFLKPDALNLSTEPTRGFIMKDGEKVALGTAANQLAEGDTAICDTDYQLLYQLFKFILKQELPQLPSRQVHLDDPTFDLRAAFQPDKCLDSLSDPSISRHFALAESKSFNSENANFMMLVFALAEARGELGVLKEIIQSA